MKRMASMTDGFSEPVVSMPEAPTNLLVSWERVGKTVRGGREGVVLLNMRGEKILEVRRKREPIVESGISSGEEGEESSVSDSVGGVVGTSCSGEVRVERRKEESSRLRSRARA